MARIPSEILFQIACKTEKDVWSIKEILETVNAEVEAREIGKNAKKRVVTSNISSKKNHTATKTAATLHLKTPPTTPHGRFENVFPVWRENFHSSFKFDVEVNPCVPTFGANFGYTTVIVDKFFCGKVGWRVWQRNTQELTGKR